MSSTFRGTKKFQKKSEYRDQDESAGRSDGGLQRCGVLGQASRLGTFDTLTECQERGRHGFRGWKSRPPAAPGDAVRDAAE
jgi:hypothetical protein